jgi:hypothetical protein
MTHVVVLRRSEAGAGDEAVFRADDLACEKGGQVWV